MPDIQSLGPWLRRFFEEYLVTERNLARNTQISYRDTFKLLLSFAADRLRKPVERLDVRDLGAELALVFLAHLEDQRACSPQSRNQRLTALRTFARFVGSRSPAHVEWCAQIRALPFKKSTPRPIEYLEKDEIDALLEAPGRATPQGRRESILLLFLYNTGARADEAAQVRVSDLQQLGEEAKATALVTLRGKRGKQRQCPLWPRTASGLAELVAGRVDPDFVFLNRRGQPITRFGIGRMVGRNGEAAAARVPSLSRKNVTPHVIRHSTATHLLRAGVDLNTIRAWLGHVKLDTTNIYAEIDFETKARAIALCDQAESEGTRAWKRDAGIIAFLRTL